MILMHREILLNPDFSPPVYHVMRRAASQASSGRFA